jgi:hypothetical protein
VAPLLGATLVALSACGESGAHALGESAHFRLFLGDGLDLETVAGGTVDDVLAGLETNWADTSTLLHMPEGRIDYYLISADAVTDRCGGSGEIAACEDDLTVWTTRVAEQHELNHAYMELRSRRRPAPMVLEGFANAIGCGETGTTQQGFNAMNDWRDLVDYSSYGDVYAPGRELMRHLILIEGVDRVVDYYLQAPDTRDSATFGANFLSYWGRDLDAVWAAMQVAQPLWGPTNVLPVCPCSLPPWSSATAPGAVEVVTRGPTNPYWTWPALDGDTALWAGNAGAVVIRDCPEQNLQPPSPAVLTFARLDGPLYAQVSGATVSRDHFLSDRCADAEVYNLPASLLPATGSVTVTLAVSRSPGAGTPVYLALQAPSPLRLASLYGAGTFSQCSSCDLAAPDCHPLPRSSGAEPVSGLLRLRWDLPAGDAPYAVADLQISAP